MLVLRQRYDAAMREGQIEDQGEVMVELPELQEAYQDLTGRPMPEVGPLRETLRALRRWSVVRLIDAELDDPQPFRILVRPAIVDIVGAQWLQRLDQHNRDEDRDEGSSDSLDEGRDAAPDADAGEAADENPMETDA